MYTNAQGVQRNIRTASWDSNECPCFSSQYLREVITRNDVVQLCLRHLVNPPLKGFLRLLRLFRLTGQQVLEPHECRVLERKFGQPSRKEDALQLRIKQQEKPARIQRSIEGRLRPL